jgi:hypothetical protein
MIDTLNYTRELESAGLNSKQAEKMVRAQMNMISDSVATKADIYQLRYEMSEKFASLEPRLAKIDSLEKNLEKNLIIKLGGLMVTCFFLSFAGLGLAAKFLL